MASYDQAGRLQVVPLVLLAGRIEAAVGDESGQIGQCRQYCQAAAADGEAEGYRK